MRQCAWAEILPPIWAFFVPREQFPVCSLNGGDNKQHVGLQTRLRFPLGGSQEPFSREFHPKPKVENIFPFWRIALPLVSKLD